MKSGGSFTLLFGEGGRATSISHSVGAQAQIPSRVYLDSRFALYDNHRHFKSAIKLHPTSMLLRALFGTVAPQPPFLVHLNKPGAKRRGFLLGIMSRGVLRLPCRRLSRSGRWTPL